MNGGARLLLAALGCLAGACGAKSIGSLAGDGSTTPDDAAPAQIDATCVSEATCLELNSEYARALSDARRCGAGAAGTCQLSVPATLRCGGSCPTIVNERGELDRVRDRWRQAGCDACFAGAACPVCVPSVAPMCTPAGSVTSQPGQGYCEDSGIRTCPPGLATGSPCATPIDYCLGGGHNACTCGSTGTTWTCS
jgi:hypothetical protein